MICFTSNNFNYNLLVAPSFAAETYLYSQYLEMLKWDVLSHPSYSPDIAPSDYLFRRMQQVTGSLLSQKSKIGSKIESPPKTSHFFEIEFENCLRDGKK